MIKPVPREFKEGNFWFSQNQFYRFGQVILAGNQDFFCKIVLALIVGDVKSHSNRIFRHYQPLGLALGTTQGSL